jgi:glycosyltransferase involved in cell wall biosynthesis
MKVLHISALPVWSMGGKGGMPSLQETLKGHIREGHELLLILPRYDLFSDNLIPLSVGDINGAGIHTAPCSWIPFLKNVRNRFNRVSGRDIIPYPIRWLLNVSMLLLLTFSLFVEARKLCRRTGFKPDLVYSHNQYAALTGFLVGRMWLVPNVTRLYGTFLADLMKIPLVVLRYPTAAAGYLVPSDMIICANDGTRGDEVARRFKISSKRFRFWQNGISPPLTKPRVSRKEIISKYGSVIRENAKWVISCSRLSGWKRIDRMLYAMKICIEKGVDCQLIIAGDGPEKKALKKIAHDLNLADNVIWIGAVKHNEIWSLMNAADAFMITNDVTNRCNPLYEAAWAGLPVISVKDPSTSDLLEDGVNALLSEKNDAEKIGKNLRRLFFEKDLAKKMGTAQQKLSESFWTWEERMKVEVKELEKIVSLKNN